MRERSAPATLTVAGRLFATRFVGVAIVLCLFGIGYGVMTVNVAVGLRKVEVAGVDFDGTRVVSSTRSGIRSGDGRHRPTTTRAIVIRSE